MIIRKPKLTDEQKIKFEQELAKIIAQAPMEIQNIGFKISWDLVDIPHHTTNIIAKLPRKLKDKYVSLKRKLDDRTL